MAIVNFKCIPIKQTFPHTFSNILLQDSLETEITFRIYACDTDESHIKRNNFGNISLIGNLPELSLGVEYEVRAKEEKKDRGYQYKVVSIKRNKPMDSFAVRMFLSELLTKSQVDEIMREYPNIIDIVNEGKVDTIDLKKLHGIGDYIIKVIERKILENFKFAEIIAEFNGLLDYDLLKKLYTRYPTVEEIKQEIKNNPYECLTDLNRIGFKTADKIILNFEKDCKSKEKEGEEPPVNFDYDVRTSKQRLTACVDYLLSENEKQGHTKMKLEELAKNCSILAKDCYHHMVDLLRSDKFAIKKPYVARKEVYETEKYLADTIKFVLDNPKVWNFELEKYKDSGLTDEQFSMLDTVCKSSIGILNGSAGCVDSNTEYFNGEKWVKISEYVDGDKVLQFNEDRTATLVIPNEYIKKPCDNMWHIKTYNGSIDQMLSDEHRVVYETSRGNLGVKIMSDLVELNKQSKNGFTGKFLSTFSYDGEGINLTDEEIRVAIATMADGHFPNKNTNRCRFNLKKERKHIRLRELFTNANITWEEHDWNPKDHQYINFIANVPLIEKEFSSMWYNCSKHQLEIVLEELLFWDGHVDVKGRRSFSTVSKQSADFVQFASSACGYNSSIATYDRTGQEYKTAGKMYTRKSVEYEVHISKNKDVRLSLFRKPDTNLEEPIKQCKSTDGFKYCFSVDSGMLVLRRNNRIFITGNSGKSHTTSYIIKMLEDNGISYELSAPTGKASKVIASYTKRNARTVHRMLGAKGADIFDYGEDHKLDTDVIIVDEFGMMDIFLTKQLFSAIDFTKTKLILVGDSNQLPSVSCGNVFHDVLQCKSVPKTILTKVFRYGVGGIMTVATNTRMMKETITDSTKKQHILGEDKGYIYFNTNQESMIKNLTSLYEKLLESNEPEDIAVLTSYNKGDYGTIAINNKLQSLANPFVDIDDSKCIKVFDTKFYVNDLIMQNVNNYKAKVYKTNKYDSYNEEDELTFISNGETGVIQQIDNYKAVVKFGNEMVEYSHSDLTNCRLAYACTIHKKQGDASKHVILLTPKAHTYMLNSNLIYVGLTRATDRVYHFGELKTFNRAIKIKENFDRQTFLQDMLKSS